MAEHTDPNTGKTIKHYLVKWRSMQYEDSTWELEEDVDPVKIQQYGNNNKRPPKEKWKVKVYNFNSFVILNFFYLCHIRALSLRWICPLIRL
jgi:''chromo'' (CHRromatin Organisation MOdifier) domain.